MCDTLYKKLGETSAIFLKNSDRAANEPNLVLFYPERKAGGEIQCTYISIPNEGACRVLLYKPSWIWGAEMGINEYGVTIGNEAVWTKSKDKKTEKLLGMDLLRLALEQSKTAKNAVDVIIRLLETYGQGGNAGFDHAFYYDNSFLIADAAEAYVLETSGRHWAWKEVKTDANISNRLSIGTDYDRSSLPGDFTKRNIEPIVSFFSGSSHRKQLGACALSSMNKSIDLKAAFSVLRQHQPETDNQKLFTKGSVKSVCMHAGPLIGDHTTGSMVVLYDGGKPYIWLTGSSTPCLSIFKPVSFEYPFAPAFAPKNKQDSLNYWLEREKVNRIIYSGGVDSQLFAEETHTLEESFIDKSDILISGKVSEKVYSEFCRECSERESTFYRKFLKMSLNPNAKPAKFWKKKTAALGRNVFERELSLRKP